MKRNLFGRRSLRNTAAKQSAAKALSNDPARHPAMRCLSVSPVHGHHCICDRCNQQRAA